MLSIIITHHQTPILLKLCLKSIKENIGFLEHEIIIVDSKAEPDIQTSVKEEFPQVKFISFSKNVGYAKIVNAGIQSAKGEYLLIVNADILFLKNSVSLMLDYLKNNPCVGIVAPRLLTFSNQIQTSFFRFPTIGAIIARRTFLGRLKWGKRKLNQFLMKDEDFSLPKPVDWVQGSAMMVKKEAIDKVGLWDERFFMYLEDADWCYRFWQNGYQVVYLPNAQMSHYYGRASKKWGGFLDIFLNKYTRTHLISAFKYFWKWRKTKEELFTNKARV
jgi:hypothetical protein